MTTSVSCDSNASNHTIKGYFIYGRLKSTVIDFPSNTDMTCINDHIYNRFNNVLPSDFKIQFYSCEAKRVLSLNADIIRSENNPFLSNSIDRSNVAENIQDPIQFMIEDYLPQDLRNSSEIGMHHIVQIACISSILSDALLDTLTPSDLDNALVDDSFLDLLDGAFLSPTATLNSLNEGRIFILEQQ